MESNERNRILRRITSGVFYGEFLYRGTEYNIKFIQPNLGILVQADEIYNKFYNSGLGKIFTIQESYDILKKQKIWTDKLQNEYDTLNVDIKILREKLIGSTYLKKQQQSLTTAIKRAKEKIEKLENIKGQLYGSTLEYLADKSKKRFIVKNCVKFEEIQLLEDINFLDSLVVYLYRDNNISESIIRELARTDPWRLYWIVSKGTGTPLFPHSCIEITDDQYHLLFWTKIYDFAYESSNRPSDDIIKDDEKFDSWYSCEVERLNKNNNEIKMPQGVGGQEIYVMADEEGSREVYALNNEDGKRRIRQRQQALEKKGSILEEQLPDIVNDLRMEANKLK